MSQPIHIVMTPTRNEAWVIRAFLESTMRWVDYVIICDQFSTDGTREIVAQYAALSRKSKAGVTPVSATLRSKWAVAVGAVQRLSRKSKVKSGQR